MVLNAENLTLSLPGREPPVFRDVSLNLEEGEIGIIKGGAGSGKTMLGLACCGFLPSWVGSFSMKGRIELLGGILKQGERPRDVGVILENPYTQLSGMKGSVRQELAFSLECRGLEPEKMPPLIEQYAGELGVSHLLDRNVRSLSGGELQRVLIAGTLISQPRFLFLDRPLTEIDEEFRPALMDIFRSHIGENDGAALIAEDSWLLPEKCFEREFYVDSGEEQSISLKKYAPVTPHEKPSDHNDNLLLIESVTFTYGDNKPVIDDLSFSLGYGEVLFITGPNGAGAGSDPRSTGWGRRARESS